MSGLNCQTLHVCICAASVGRTTCCYLAGYITNVTGIMLEMAVGRGACYQHTPRGYNWLIACSVRSERHSATLRNCKTLRRLHYPPVLLPPWKNTETETCSTQGTAVHRYINRYIFQHSPTNRQDRRQHQAIYGRNVASFNSFQRHASHLGEGGEGVLW